MSTYFLARKVKAVQTAPGGTHPAPTDVMPSWAVGNNPPPAQAFSLTVNGIGAVSATAQVYVAEADDDAPNWAPYLDPISVSGTVLAANSLPMTTANGNAPHRRFTAIITAISGTNADATLRMSA